MEFRVVCSVDGGGTLVVEDGSRIKFNPDSDSDSWISRITLIKNLKVSRSTSKLRMTINHLDTESDILLSFISTEERDTFSEALRKSKSKKMVEESDLPDNIKLSSHAATRAHILSSDSSLGILHKDVVIDRSWITDDDFWSDPARKSSLCPPQKAGPRSAHFTRELIAEKDANSETYKLNKQLILDIFTEYPAVEHMYRCKVLNEGMKESDFWVHFLTSSYFSSREVRGARRAENRNIFESIAGQQELNNEQKDTQTQPLTDTLEKPTNKEIGYGTRKPSEWLGMMSNVTEDKSSNQDIGNRFNRHSSKILNSLMPNTNSIKTNNKTINNLTQDKVLDTQQIVKTKLPAPEISKRMKLSRHVLESVSQRGISITYKINDKSATTQKPSNATPIDDKLTKWLLSEEAHSAQKRLLLTEDRTCSRTRELLKHFWRNVSDNQIDEVSRIHTILLKILTEFDNAIPTVKDTLLLQHYNLLRKMISRALAVQGQSGWNQ